MALSASAIHCEPGRTCRLHGGRIRCSKPPTWDGLFRSLPQNSTAPSTDAHDHDSAQNNGGRVTGVSDISQSEQSDVVEDLELWQRTGHFSEEQETRGRKRRSRACLTG